MTIHGEHETTAWAFRCVHLAFSALFWELVYATKLDLFMDWLERKMEGIDG